VQEAVPESGPAGPWSRHLRSRSELSRNSNGICSAAKRIWNSLTAPAGAATPLRLVLRDLGLCRDLAASEGGPSRAVSRLGSTEETHLSPGNRGEGEQAAQNAGSRGGRSQRLVPRGAGSDSRVETGAGLADREPIRRRARRVCVSSRGRGACFSGSSLVVVPRVRRPGRGLRPRRDGPVGGFRRGRRPAAWPAAARSAALDKVENMLTMDNSPR
jgi:hypothetical protein